MSDIRYESQQSQEKALLNRIQNIVENKLKYIANQIVQNQQYKMQQIKMEINISFQNIINITFQRVFTETYGNNYDINSLYNSIFFNFGNDLRPNFSYNKNLFQFNTTLKKDERAFNQNARKYGTFKETLDYDYDFYTQETEDLFFSSFDSTPYDDAIDEVDIENINDYNIFSPYNKMNQQGGYASLDETYIKAQQEALQEFEKEYNVHIKPQILKKYGIKL